MSLCLVLGPMNSGKTTDLLGEAARISAVGLKVLFVNSSIDTRTTTEVSTHNPLLSLGTKLPHVTFVKVSRLGDLNLSDYHSVMIDEGHFFDDLESSVRRFVKVDQKNVWVGGLNCDYNQEPFGQIPQLTALCHRFIFKTSYCVRCARETNALVPATCTARLNRTERAQVLVGDSKLYETMCSSHYAKLYSGQ